jgi:hypothetical protein
MYSLGETRMKNLNKTISRAAAGLAVVSLGMFGIGSATTAVGAELNLAGETVTFAIPFSKRAGRRNGPISMRRC